MQALLEILTKQLDAVAFTCDWYTKQAIAHGLAERGVSPGYMGTCPEQFLLFGVAACNDSLEKDFLFFRRTLIGFHDFLEPCFRIS